MADTLERLRRIFLEHPDAKLRQEAGRALSMRGDPWWKEQMQGRIAKQAEKTARLKAEAGSYTGGYGDVATAMVDTASSLATDPMAWEELYPGATAAAEGLQDIPDWLTGGGYRAVRRAIAPESSAANEQIAAEHPVARGFGRAAATVPLGAAIAPTAGSALGTAGVTGAMEYPQALGRRTSEGEELGKAAVGAGKDALIAAATAGAIRKIGGKVDARSRKMRTKEAGAGAMEQRRAAGVPDDQKLSEVVGDDGFQVLKQRNAERLKVAGQQYDDLADQFLANAKDVDVDKFRQRLFDARRTNSAPNGEIIDEALEKSFEKIEKLTTPKEIGGAVPVEGILQARKLAQTKARFNAPTRDATDEAWGTAYHELNAAIDAMDDTGKFAQARSVYRTAIEREQQINAHLTGREGEKLGDIAGNALTESARLRKLATAKGGAGARVARDLEQLDPESAAVMEKIRAAHDADVLATAARRAEEQLAEQTERLGTIRRMGQRVTDVTMRSGRQPDPRVAAAVGIGAAQYRREEQPQVRTAAMPTNPLVRAARAEETQGQSAARAILGRAKKRREVQQIQEVDPITGEVY